MRATSVNEACEQVMEAFPFPNYISRGKAIGTKFIATRILNYVTPRARLLDIGCGPMDQTAAFAKLGYECYAVDDLADPWHRRDGNLERILRFAQEMGISFHHQAEGDYSIPFDTGSFDVVLVSAVIEHLHESPRQLLNAAGEFLKEGGLLCVTMPNSVNLRKRLSVLFGRSNYPPIDQFYACCGKWRGHVREYTLAETSYICRKAGFDVVETMVYEENAFDKLSPPSLAIFRLLCRLVPTFGSALLVLSRKPTGWVPALEDPIEFRNAQAASVPAGVH